MSAINHDAALAALTELRESHIDPKGHWHTVELYISQQRKLDKDAAIGRYVRAEMGGLLPDEFIIIAQDDVRMIDSASTDEKEKGKS